MIAGRPKLGPIWIDWQNLVKNYKRKIPVCIDVIVSRDVVTPER